MADYSGTQSIPNIPTNLMAGTGGLIVFVEGTASTPSGGGGVTTTYFYRLSIAPYTRGTATTLAGVPPGSVIEAVITT